jgi:hypothetical protein
MFTNDGGLLLLMLLLFSCYKVVVVAIDESPLTSPCALRLTRFIILSLCGRRIRFKIQK